MKRIKVVAISCSFAILSLIAVQYFSIKTTIKYNQDNYEIALRNKKMGEIYSIMNLLLDIETGIRGFLLTGNPLFLEPYENAIKDLPDEIENLSFFISPQEKSELQILITKRVELGACVVKKKLNSNAIISSDLEDGKIVMDKIRLFTNKLLRIEEAKDNTRNLDHSDETITIRLIVGSLFSLILISLCIFYVISEFKKRIRTEKELQVSLATSEAISRGIDFGVIVCDTLGNILFTNKWISNKVSKMKEVYDFFTTNESLRPIISQLVHGEIETIEEAELNIKDQVKVFKINSAPFSINGVIEGKVISVIDTTNSAQKIASLVSDKHIAEIASKAKSDFVAKMSHEIRTPLNAILGVGEILSLSKLDNEQEKCLEIFKRSAITLNNLVNDILDLSKIEAGKIDIIESSFSLKNLLDSCTSIMDFRASQKGLLFSTSIDSQFDHFIGDEGRLRQIILNLLSNAIKFTEKGEVNFSVRCLDLIGDEKKELIFIVRDSGRGISPQNVGKLFSDYQQENDSTSQEFGGTGLGLSLSRELARLMNSDISLKSELGIGSEFTFKISLSLGQGDFVENIIEAKLLFHKLKILLVDDNQENRFIVKKYLSDFKIEIIEAIDGEDAIIKFKADTFDLVFMDINMPKKDGITATTELRQYENDNRIEKTLIIALSANALTLEYTKAMAAGCDDYITKPISRLKLIHVIKKWVVKSKNSINEDEELVELLNDDNDEEIDLDIKALIPVYLESRLKDLTTIEEAFNKNDIQTIAKLVHNIKGTALSYGQQHLDLIAKAMESAIQNNDMKELESFIKKMVTLLRGGNGH